MIFYQVKTGNHVHLETIFYKQAETRLEELSDDAELVEIDPDKEES